MESQGNADGRQAFERPKMLTGLDQFSLQLSGTTRKGEFKCKICGKISASKIGSFGHIESKHFPGQYEYNCDRCNKKFDTYRKLTGHRQRKCPPAPSDSVFE